MAEVKAIKKVFTDMSHVKMNATKSLIGHCLGAAAGIEAVAVVKAIETGWLHPTLNQHNLIDEVRSGMTQRCFAWGCGVARASAGDCGVTPGWPLAPKVDQRNLIGEVRAGGMWRG